MVMLYLSLLSRLEDLGERVRSDEGATAVEYGLMVALIAGGIIVAVTFLREQLNTLFNDVGTKLHG